MLTRELLLYRVRQGRIHPSFLELAEPSWLAVAQDLVAIAADAPGSPREDVEAALDARALTAPRPKVGQGLAKLVLDRIDFDEPRPEVSKERVEVLRAAAQVLRGLAPEAALADYEAHLAARLPRPLSDVRAALHADLPDSRPAKEFRAVEPARLLERYNLALVQGHLLAAQRLTLVAFAPELLRVRKVLRWLKWCRLVAEVRRDGADWRLDVEGPGAVVELQRKYGLQLANFLAAVPLLERWQLEAKVKLPRAEVLLRLGEADPLASPLGSALGHVPPEVDSLSARLAELGWRVDDTPVPRHVGATGMCVPDLALYPPDGRELVLELFHPWHQGPLARRLEELRARPDPALLLGVERALAKRLGRLEELEAHPQVLLFHGFPSAKAVVARATRQP